MKRPAGKGTTGRRPYSPTRLAAGVYGHPSAGTSNVRNTWEKTMDQATQTKWQGRWDQVTGHAKKAWGQLTDDDLKVAEGDFEALAGKIKERTGETSEAIQAKFDSFGDDDNSDRGELNPPEGENES